MLKETKVFAEAWLFFMTVKEKKWINCRFTTNRT